MRHPATNPRSRPPFVLTLLMVGMVLSGCTAAGNAVVAEHEVLARSVVAAWERGDGEELAEFFWPDAIYDDFANATTWQGIEEIMAYKSEVHLWAQDLSVNITALQASATGVVAEWVLYGTQVAARPGETDREVFLNGVTVFEVERGLVTRAADYLDTLPLVLQMGGRVVMPDGEVRELAGG